VPGPQFPLYALGRELQELFPVAFLPDNHALAVAIISYNGGNDFGLLGDYDAMPDLDEFAGFLDDARQELKDAAMATASNGDRSSTRARTSRPRTSSRVSTGA
jgi:diacylglycerol O-acyltransferase